MNKLPCPFRFNERQLGNETVATCGLIQQLLQCDDAEVANVTRDACEACCGSTPTASSFVNEVFPSLLSLACEKSLDRQVLNDASADRARELMSIVEAAVVNERTITRDRIAACDVFLCCEDASEQTHRSIKSVLEQKNATVLLHLAIFDDDGDSLAADYGQCWNIRIHRFDKPNSVFGAFHELAPLASSEFIAFQDAASVSYPTRIANAIGELERTAGDVVASPLDTPSRIVPACAPDETYQWSVPWSTLVFRRSTFIDLGGFADREGDQDVELLHRAVHSAAKIELLPFASARSSQSWEPPRVGEQPVYDNRFQSLRHHGMGYSSQRVACDVVLPLYKQLDYADAAIESVIEQDGAEAIVHIVDDQSPEDTSALLRRWKTHPRVRLYRNSLNIGQYASFNNVSDYFETDLVAIQDSDDISLPNRLHSSGNLLRLCNADFFGAAVERFGDEALMQHDPNVSRYRRSFYPYGQSATYFVMNPTSCFDVSMFRRLGGYGDFGGRRYKAGLDSEFMSRAYYSGVRFAISSEVVTRYRVHDQSATRNQVTGWGTEPRKVAVEECRRRQELYQPNSFDPRVFGAIGRYRGITKRL